MPVPSAIFRASSSEGTPALYWDMYRKTRQSPGGIAAKAIAGIDCALWDIKAKAFGVPVYELFGGPMRERQRLYWSHCGTFRAGHHELLGVPPLRTMDDIARLGEEVVTRGFTALKTNILFPGDPARVYFAGFGGGPGTTDQNISSALIRHIRELIGAFRSAVGDDVDIALDLNFNFKPEGAALICQALEEFNMMWVEVDIYDPEALRRVKDATRTPICSGENLIGLREYRRYLDARAQDVLMVDVPWNGFTLSKKIADLAESYEINIAPHNYYSHLSTLMSAHLCACAPNVRIQEIDIDDVPWKDDLIDQTLVIENGDLYILGRPGWGANLNETVAREHPWRG